MVRVSVRNLFWFRHSISRRGVSGTVRREPKNDTVFTGRGHGQCVPSSTDNVL